MICTTWKRGNAQGYSCKTPNLQSHGDFDKIFNGNPWNILQGSWPDSHQPSSGGTWNWRYKFQNSH